jgi:hypothetical protein
MKDNNASLSHRHFAGVLIALALGASSVMPAGADVTVQYNYTLWNNTGFEDPVEGPARKEALEEVVNYMLGQLDGLQNGRTLKISIAPDNTSGTLAGASVQFAGNPNSYVDSAVYRNLVLGINTGGSSYDIVMFYNFNAVPAGDLYIGTGVPGPTQVEFRTLTLHELTHGLGENQRHRRLLNHRKQPLSEVLQLSPAGRHDSADRACGRSSDLRWHCRRNDKR